MNYFALVAAAVLLLEGTAAAAQQGPSDGIRVKPGHFCALNKCVRFSRDLSAVSIQGRRPVSVAAYGLGTNPLVSAETYNEIFYLALRQKEVGSGSR